MIRIGGRKWLTILGWSFGILFAGQANAEELTQCVQRSVTFEGITPLSYATISGDAGSKAYFHAQYPAECTSADSTACKAPAYVLSGDAVTVGKTCGAWAYVQYIGEKRITTGWVRAVDLGKPRSIAPRRNLMIAGSTGQEPVFALTRGNNTPVCVAYLQRLNQSEFTHPAYCGRPEDDQVPGFRRLHRVLVSPTEVRKLADLVTSITYPQVMIESRYFDAMNESGGVFNGIPRPAIVPNSDSYTTWRSEPPVDIDNDGVPDNVLIWSLDDAVHPHCGEVVPGPTRIEQNAFVMSADGSTVDQARTIQIFGHPDGGYAMVPGTQGLNGPIHFLKSLRLLGNSYSVFQYRHLYYFDTFYDLEFPVSTLGDFNDKRKGSAKLPDTLAVFLRKNGKTLPVCEYYVTE